MEEGGSSEENDPSPRDLLRYISAPLTLRIFRETSLRGCIIAKRLNNSRHLTHLRSRTREKEREREKNVPCNVDRCR